MITIKYEGRLGNNIIQYCVGRIIQSELGFYMDANQGTRYDLNSFLWQTEMGEFKTPIYTNRVQVLNEHDIKSIADIEKIISNKTPRKIILNGYFQNYKILLPYHKQIKEWCPLKKYNVDKDVMAIHFRLTDYKAHWRPHPQYYIDCISKCKPSRVFVFYDKAESIEDKKYIHLFTRLYNKKFPKLQINFKEPK
jgi:hypothetical protein